jgi:hypothetical protein
MELLGSQIARLCRVAADSRSPHFEETETLGQLVCCKENFEALLMKESVFFYARQSDTLGRLNRHLIRFALNLAAQSISNDPAVEVRVRIDADTEGVLGHVPITDTILKKIDACDAFVPDLTFVAATPADKLGPNPNVMLEWGYALRGKSHFVMIPVMNTAYGPPENLPFDMGHLRHPLEYKLAATATTAQRREVREALARDFEKILRAMIAAAPVPQRTPFTEAQSVTSPAFFFEQGAPIANFGNPGEQQYRFEGEKAIFLGLFPKYGDGQPEPSRARVRSLLRDQRVVNPMSIASGSIAAANDHGWIVIDPRHNNLTQTITQAFPTGELWGINSQVFVRTSIRRTFMSPEEPATALAVIGAEKAYTRALEHYASIAAGGMKLRPPFVIEIGAVGLKDVYLGAPDEHVSKNDIPPRSV